MKMDAMDAKVKKLCQKYAKVCSSLKNLCKSVQKEATVYKRMPKNEKKYAQVYKNWQNKTKITKVTKKLSLQKYKRKQKYTTNFKSRLK